MYSSPSGFAEKISARRTLLDDHAAVEHDGNSIGEPRDNGEVVADHEERLTPILGGLEQVENLRLDRDVQCRSGFVGNEQRPDRGRSRMR